MLNLKWEYAHFKMYSWEDLLTCNNYGMTLESNKGGEGLKHFADVMSLWSFCSSLISCWCNPNIFSQSIHNNCFLALKSLL